MNIIYFNKIYFINDPVKLYIIAEKFKKFENVYYLGLVSEKDRTQNKEIIKRISSDRKIIDMFSAKEQKYQQQIKISDLNRGVDNEHTTYQGQIEVDYWLVPLEEKRLEIP